MNTIALTWRRLFSYSQRCSVFSPQRSPKRFFAKTKVKLLIGLVPVIPSICAQSESKSDKPEVEPKTKGQISIPEESIVTDESEGWKRLRAMYEDDEYGHSSKELIAVYQATSFACLSGFIYGGVTSSREAFIDFMERNQATAFDNHLDAKRRLQNHVTIHFGKGAFRWGVKLGAFTGCFMLFVTTMNAYRGHISALDYAVSGTIVGALLRLKHGPRAMVVGGTIGGILSLLCGLSTKGLLAMWGTDFDEVLSFQYEIEQSRQRLFDEGVKKSQEKKAAKGVIELLQDYDEKTKDEKF